MIYSSSYAASKKALNSFFEDVSFQHCTDGIYCTLAQLGPIKTPFIEKCMQQRRKINDSKIAPISMNAKRAAHLMLTACNFKLFDNYIASQPTLFSAYVYNNYRYYINSFLFRTFHFQKFFEKLILKD